MPRQLPQVLVGQACVLYGAAQFSRDLDLLILVSESNLERLNAALAELDAVNIAAPKLTPDYLRRGHAVRFRCRVSRGSRPPHRCPGVPGSNRQSPEARVYLNLPGTRFNKPQPNWRTCAAEESVALERCLMVTAGRVSLNR